MGGYFFVFYENSKDDKKYKINYEKIEGGYKISWYYWGDHLLFLVNGRLFHKKEDSQKYLPIFKVYDLSLDANKKMITFIEENLK